MSRCGLGFRVQGLGLRAQGIGFRVVCGFLRSRSWDSSVVEARLRSLEEAFVPWQLAWSSPLVCRASNKIKLVALAR